VPETIFYDGTCGFCHRGVRFVLTRDAAARFRFAPLQGTTFRNALPAAERSSLPDSMVLKTADGRLLLRSEAAIHVLYRLGGGWRLPAALLRLVPGRVRDTAYDWIASHRYRLFRRPAEFCPVLPDHLRARFDP
jgi:predicted DCC family thiol-disulfide oxidoreductase YuxK